mgnify:CR=1 FL=1
MSVNGADVLKLSVFRLFVVVTYPGIRFFVTQCQEKNRSARVPPHAVNGELIVDCVEQVSKRPSTY